MSISPGESRRLAVQASRMIQEYRYSEAHSLLTRVIDGGHETARAYRLRGICAVFLDSSLQSSIRDYTAGLKIDPVHCGCLMSRGHAHLRCISESSLRLAVSDYSKVIEIQPKNAEGWECRGIALSRLRDFPGALSDYDVALSINPDYPDGLSGRGLLYCYQGRKDLANLDFDRGFAVTEDSGLASRRFLFAYRGLARLHWGDYEGSDQDYTVSLEIATVRKDHLAAAVVLWRRAFVRSFFMPEQAPKDLKQSYDIDPDFPLIAAVVTAFPHMATLFDGQLSLFGDTPEGLSLRRALGCPVDSPSERWGFIMKSFGDGLFSGGIRVDVRHHAGDLLFSFFRSALCLSDLF